MSVSVSSDGGVTRIVIDDGKANVATSEVAGALDAAVKDADPTNVLLLVGRPGTLSAGFDLGTLRAGGGAAAGLVGSGIEVLLGLLRFPSPVVIACTGHAVGFGAFLLLAGDQRIVADGDWRIGLPEVGGGITIPPSLIALPRSRLDGEGMRRVLHGETVTPAEAVARGYADIVEEGDVVASAETEAVRLGRLDRAAFANTKRNIRQPVIDEVLASRDADLRAVGGAEP